MHALSGSHGYAGVGVVRGYGAYADAVAVAAGEGGVGGGEGVVFAVREG